MSARRPSLPRFPGADRASAILSCWVPSQAAYPPASPAAHTEEPRPVPARPSGPIGPDTAVQVRSVRPPPVASAAAAGTRLRGAVPAPSLLRREAPRVAMAGADSQVGPAAAGGRAGATSVSSALPPLTAGRGGVLRRGLPLSPRQAWRVGGSVRRTGPGGRRELGLFPLALMAGGRVFLQRRGSRVERRCGLPEGKRAGAGLRVRGAKGSGLFPVVWGGQGG